VVAHKQCGDRVLGVYDCQLINAEKCSMWMRGVGDGYHRDDVQLTGEIPHMPQIQQGPNAVQEAGRRLRQGGLVVIPTETVYGLAGSTHNPDALVGIFELKGRPQDNPLIAHVDSIKSAKRLTSQWPEPATTLTAALWPGPLTIVLPRSQDVPPIASAGLDTLAIRMPNHPVAQQILEAAGGPLSAPSANRSGRISPTTASHVLDDYHDIDAASDLLIIDGGPCDQGLESTVIDLSGSLPRLLRPGTISRGVIEDLIGPLARDPLPSSQDASPGTTLRHYAPSKPVHICQQSSMSALFDQGGNAVVIGPSTIVVPPQYTHLQLPIDPVDAARMLYTLLRQADYPGTTHIIVVLPEGEQWEAVRDRLSRAAT
jgi:L-threonylcarbamoyladenylate synthase